MAISLDELKIANNLSVRSYNVCRIAELTDIEKILTYYLKNLSFNNLQNCGRKSREELNELCEKYLHLLDKIEIEDVENLKPEITEIYRNLDDSSINEILEAKFGIEAEKLDRRANNIAFSLLNSFDNSLYQVFTYLHAQKFDYRKLKNVGKKSSKQLTLFFQELLDFANQIVDEPKESLAFKSILLQLKSKYVNLSSPIS